MKMLLLKQQLLSVCRFIFRVPYSNLHRLHATAAGLLWIPKSNSELFNNNKYFNSDTLCFKHKNQFSTTLVQLVDSDLESPLLAKYMEQIINPSHFTQDKTALCQLWNERLQLKLNLHALAELQTDGSNKELATLAEEEKAEYLGRLQTIDEKIVDILSEEHITEVDPNSLVLEITAGVGGQEAMLFASDLLDMYQGYIAYRGWEQDRAELDSSELGGLRHGSISVSGSGALMELCHEAGVHRVQRVPKTEKSGRLHTSTVTVAVLPQPTEVAIVLNPKDLKIETKRSSGAGGQHVNTTDSCVRIHHLPSGLAVECQSERSQVQNKTKAMHRLRARLYQRQLEKQQSERRDSRKQQVGSSLRSEKIRTYNFPQDRVTDHRVGLTLHNLRGFLAGGDVFCEMLSLLEAQQRKERFKRFLESLN